MLEQTYRQKESAGLRRHQPSTDHLFVQMDRSGNHYLERHTMTHELEVNEEKVTSLSDYVSRVSALVASVPTYQTRDGIRAFPDGKDIFLYRGHDDLNYELKATVYRNSSEFGISNESDIYNATIHSFPWLFSNNDDIINNLILMQHNHIPTRLIDLTFNPLVALFFAVGGYSTDQKKLDADGDVLIISANENKLSYSGNTNRLLLVGINDADRDYLRNTLRRLTYSFSEIFGLYSAITNDSLSSIIKIPFQKLSRTVKQTMDINTPSYMTLQNFVYEHEPELEQFINRRRFCNEELKNFAESDFKFLDQLSANYYRAKDDLTEWLKNEFQFVPDVNFYYYIYNIVDSFAENLLIRPSMNNERIRRQQGAFLIHPPVLSNHSLLSNDHLIGDNLIVKHIYIDKHKKQHILKELSNFGITYSFLFPELDKFAHEVHRRISLQVKPANCYRSE